MSKRGITTLVNYSVAKEDNLTIPISDILAHCSSPICLEILLHESKRAVFSRQRSTALVSYPQIQS